jgi:hypothetical protein
MKTYEMPYEVLEEALDLIWEREHWCRGALRAGEIRFEGSKGPEINYKYCALGAIYEAEDADTATQKGPITPSLEPFKSVAGRQAFKMVSRLAGGDLTRFNDTHTHAEVVALFQQAIRNEKERVGEAEVLDEEEAFLLEQEIAQDAQMLDEIEEVPV